MADQNTAVEENVEEPATSQDSSPQSEEGNTTPQTTQEDVESQEEPEEVSDDSQDGEESDSMTEEQRKAFQRMRLENKRLKEEMEARGKTENAFNAFKPQAQPGTVDINKFVDPNTGAVDWNGYNQAINTQARATAAETVQEQIDENNARQKYPEVFADPDLEEAVAGQWFASKLNGKDVSITEIAGKVAKKLSSAASRAEKIGKEKALEELTPKEQAGLKADGQTSAPSRQAQSAEDEEILRVRARNGDEEALAQLMKSVKWK